MGMKQPLVDMVYPLPYTSVILPYCRVLQDKLKPLNSNKQ